MNNDTPQIALLGLCDRLSKTGDLVPLFSVINILGLRTDVIGTIYPASVGQAILLFAVYDLPSLGDVEVHCQNREAPKEYNFQFQIRPERMEGPPVHGLSLEEIRLPNQKCWMLMPFAFPEEWRMILSPCHLDFFLVRDSKRLQIGQLRFLYARAPALTAETVSAIRSNPRAARFARAKFVCRECADYVATYTGIERSHDLENEGYVWYQDLPTEYRCKCGKTVIDMKYIRENLHSSLAGRAHGAESESELTLSRLYEVSTLQAIYDKLVALLVTEPMESAIQTFFEENPILLHRFGAQKIMPKGSILQKYQTDFIVHSGAGELFLIELERSSHRLLKKDGGRTATLNHAFDQVTDWLHAFSKHRLACLDGLDIDSTTVTSIRGVVVVGRDEGHNEERLQKLKGTDHGSVVFYTYDDFLRSMQGLIQGVRAI